MTVKSTLCCLLSLWEDGIQAEEEEQDIQAEEEEQGEEEELGIQAEEEEQDILELTSLPTISPIKSPPRRQQDKARKRRKRDYEFYEFTPIAVRRPLGITNNITGTANIKTSYTTFAIFGSFLGDTN